MYLKNFVIFLENKRLFEKQMKFRYKNFEVRKRVKRVGAKLFIFIEANCTNFFFMFLGKILDSLIVITLFSRSVDNLQKFLDFNQREGSVRGSNPVPLAPQSHGLLTVNLPFEIIFSFTISFE